MKFFNLRINLALQEAYSTSESEAETDNDEESSSISRHDMGTSVMSNITLNDSIATDLDSPANPKYEYMKKITSLTKF